MNLEKISNDYRELSSELRQISDTYVKKNDPNTIYKKLNGFTSQYKIWLYISVIPLSVILLLLTKPSFIKNKKDQKIITNRLIIWSIVISIILYAVFLAVNNRTKFFNDKKIFNRLDRKFRRKRNLSWL